MSEWYNSCLFHTLSSTFQLWHTNVPHIAESKVANISLRLQYSLWQDNCVILRTVSSACGPRNAMFPHVGRVKRTFPSWFPYNESGTVWCMYSLQFVIGARYPRILDPHNWTITVPPWTVPASASHRWYAITVEWRSQWHDEQWSPESVAKGVLQCGNNNILLDDMYNPKMLAAFALTERGNIQ